MPSRRFRLRTGQFQKLTYMPLELSVESDGEQVKTGNVFYVSSTHVNRADSAGGGTVDAPFATTDYAIGRCTPNNGDVIHPMPGSAETLTAAAAIAQDVAGISIIGLGEGNDRPRYTFQTAAGASWSITGRSSKIKNIIGIGNLDGLTNPFHLQAADCEIDIEWQDTSSLIEAARAVLTTAAADRCKIHVKYVGFTAGNAVVNAVRLVGVDNADIYVDAFGVCTTAWVEFVTTLCTNVRVNGVMFTQGITNGSRNVVDTITGSTWSADLFDASAGQHQSGGSAQALAFDDTATVAANQTVPTADSTANVLSRDVVGNKSDAAAAGAVTATDTLVAYIKQLINMLGVDADTNAIGALLSGAAGIATMPNAAVPANAVNVFELLREIWAVLNGTAAGENGVQAFPAAAAPANNVSLAEVMREIYDQAEKAVSNTTAVLVSGTTAFTIAGGPIEVLSLIARCVTGNDGTASTLQWSHDPTDGAAATFSAASASLANAAAGATVVLQGTTLATAPLVNANGPGLGQQVTNGIVLQAGIITTTIAVGSTTGTWQQHLRYRPLARGVSVS